MRRYYLSVLLILMGLSFVVTLSSCNDLGNLPPATYSTDLGMNYVIVLAPTRFTMGSPEGERGRSGNELQHEVELTRPFYIQTTEVTQSQFQEVMGSNPSFYQDCGTDCPAENVTWYQAVEFCNQLSDREGLPHAYTIAGTEVTWNQSANGYRLPTEAEWEYVARNATTDSALPTGNLLAEEVDSCVMDTNLDPIAWYCGNSSGITHRVAQKTDTYPGVFDMHGNVWEWCWDWYGQYTADTAVDPTGPDTGTRKVLRGGSAYESPRGCRSANRTNKDPDTGGLVGFRTVRNVVGE
ncbi:MAG TPA: formylglycine-generating enzyme family protein [Phycisphaerae bacterium]|nr:formylglycine-generating enzyme family protein [Phycisphaerae bacterium]HRY71264.1 formylglycine-generating enzyme family protein [Phycisphaerae bacterium]HSA29644.1 formylglycine-generating enzyme family protein [Phycisphaerae bacterium]